MNIQGMNILVTGGASGMGRHFVLALADAGANVAFCDLGADAVAAVAAEGAGKPGKVVGFVANVADEAQVVDYIAKATAALQ